MVNTVFPTLEKYQTFTLPRFTRINAFRIAAPEKFNNKVFQADGCGMVTIVMSDFRPEIFFKAAALNKFNLFFPNQSQIRKQAFEDNIEPGINCTTNRQHNQEHLFRLVTMFNLLFKNFPPFRRFEKGAVFPDKFSEFTAQPQFVQPNCHLVRIKNPVRQLHIQKPVVFIFRNRAGKIEQKLLRGFLSQNPVFQTEFIVVDLNLFNLRQLQLGKVVAHLFIVVVPEDNPMLIKKLCQYL